MGETLRFALIGTGRAADRHLAPALRKVKGARLSAVVSRDVRRAEAFAATHADGPCASYASLDEALVAPDVDAVIVALPDALHAEAAIKAAEAGKHVFVEKPMATERDDALRMIETAQAARVTLGVGYHQRWNPWHRQVRQGILPGPATGEIRHVRFRSTRSVAHADHWRTGPLGRWWSLAAAGTHVIDLATWMLEPTCGEMVAMRALLGRGRLQERADESARLLLAFASGATAEIFVSMVDRPEKRIEIECERSTLVLGDTLGATFGSGSGWLQGPDGARIHANDVDPYACELADFTYAVLTGCEPEVGGLRGLQNVEWLIRAEDDDNR